MADQPSGFGPILWSSCLAMLTVGANSTGIMAALPSMQADLSLSPAGVEWAVNAYLVVSAAFIVLGGQAADRFGPRLASLMGLALFAVASSIIALAGGQTELLGGRAIQGLAASLAVPATLVAVHASAAPERKGAATAAWTGFLMLGFSIGPLFGGAVTHFLGWRAIFWLNLPLMLAAVAGFVSVGAPTTGARGAKAGAGTDWAGFVLLAVSMVSLVFALHALPNIETAPLAVAGPFVLAAAAFALLLKVEARAKAPLLDLGFFRLRSFVFGVAIGSLSTFCIMSLLFYFNLYAQSPQGLRLTALEAGAALVPLSLSMLVVSLSASGLAKKVGTGTVMMWGMALIAAAAVIVALAISKGGVVLELGFLIIGAALAAPYALAPPLALSALPEAQGGQGSGIVNACTFLAGSTGVAGGAAASALGGMPGVLAMIACAGICGAILGRSVSKTA